MLLRFSVENYRSFDKRVELSMAPNNKIRRFENHIIRNGNLNINKAAFVFGPNASGKSNLIKAIYFSKQIIVHGIDNIPLAKQYFRSNKENKNKPGIFQYEIAINDDVYSYGFAISYVTGEIIEEWLYKIRRNGKDFCVFDRGENGNIKTDIRFDIDTSNRFNVYKEDIKTMKTTLFLSEMAKKKIKANDLQVFTNVFSWFKKLTIIFPESVYGRLFNIIADKEMKQDFLDYLKHFDTGVTDVISSHIEDMNILDKEILNILNTIAPKSLKQEGDYTIKGPGLLFSIQNKDGKIAVDRLLLEHGNPDELFDLMDESDGTQRLFHLIPVFTLNEERVVIIDEINRSLHPKLTIDFVDLFFQATENKRIQMIITTHESALLDLEILRQDEIWFMERNIDHSSSLYSLDKYKIRKDKDIMKDYLLGRYGAIPTFSTIDCSGEIEGEER